MTRIRIAPGSPGPETPGPARLRLVPGLLQPRTVGRGDRWAHVALVAGGAMLLGGDHVRVEVEVEDGCVLEIEDVGGTVAYESTGEPSRMDITIRLGKCSRLLWRAHPFVIAGGADVDRTTSIELGRHSSVLLRETLVLGRSGERGGLLRSSVHAREADGTPVFLEDLALDGARPRAGVLGDHRVLDSALLLGCRPPDPADASSATTAAGSVSAVGTGSAVAPPAPGSAAPRVLHLERAGAIARSLGPHAHASGIGAIMEKWERT
ncbi:urease accessory protein UreD [Brachybacterium sp. NPDC056505]|uniref:urease accessory protein UreD n=1 Tax=Brachybacterium sp. NPDC056505 TaxID=3345843 RepID=UPI00366CC45C